MLITTKMQMWPFSTSVESTLWIFTESLGHTLSHRSQHRHHCVTVALLIEVNASCCPLTHTAHGPLPCQDWWIIVVHSWFKPRLPAAVALGRSETVMSGGKLTLGGSSTSASGPSAILPKCRTCTTRKRRLGGTATLLPPKTRQTRRLRSGERHQNKQTWPCWWRRLLRSLRYFLTALSWADLKGKRRFARPNRPLKWWKYEHFLWVQAVFNFL